MKLLRNERIDYIGNKNLKIIQSTETFPFSLESILLAKFVHIQKQGKVVDLCSGNAVIPLLLSERTDGEITAIEIQEKLCNMAERSVRLNQLEDRIHIICSNLNELDEHFLNDTYDVVTCNPPYFKVSAEKDVKKGIHFAIARHELFCTLEDVVRTTSELLKYRGKGAFVHRTSRLLELLTYMRKYNLEPKRLQFVHPRIGKDANIVLVEGIKNGKPNLKVLPPLTVYDEGNQYTDEIRKLLYG